MRNVSLAILAAVAVSTGAQAGLTFKQVKNVDLTTSFTGADNNFAAGRHGDFLGSVAFDGSNVFVSGFSTSGTKRGGVVKVDNVTGVGASTSAHYFTQTLVGASRMSKVLYANGGVYYAYGLSASTTAANDGGDTQGTAAGVTFGIKRLTGVDTADGGFSGGHLNFREFKNLVSTQGRIDSIDYDSVNNELLGIDFFDQKVYRVNATTGSFVGSYILPGGASAGQPTGDGDDPGQYRDMAYDAATGRLFTRSTISLSNSNTSLRASAESLQLSGGNFINRKNLFIGNAATDGITAKVAFSGAYGSIPEFIAVNDTVSKTIKFLSTSDGSLLGEMLGTEDGFAAISHFFNTTTFGKGADGKLYAFVVESNVGGTSDKLRVYQVVPEPGTYLALGAGVAVLALRRRKTQ